MSPGPPPSGFHPPGRFHPLNRALVRLPKVLCSSAGFTYIAALMIVVVMGIMLGAAGQSWQMRMKREREAELLFRGLEYQRAIRRWHQYDLTEGKPLQTISRPRRPLNDLGDLLKDPGSLAKERYIRRLYTDPFTGDEFQVIRNPQMGIIGVYVGFDDKPLKQGNFGRELSHLEQKKSYSEWIFGLPEAVTPSAGTGASTSPAPPGGTVTSPAGR